MRLRLICCDVFHREACAAVVRSPNYVDLDFLPQGLHSEAKGTLLSRVQGAIDGAEGKGYDAIALGYGLCGNGVIGLTARTTKLVMPRAHDCITFFLGTKERYKDYFFSHVGEYFLTSGWFERGHDSGPRPETPGIDPFGMYRSREELIAKFGEEDAAYIISEIGDKVRNYDTYTYIDMGIEPGDIFEKKAQEEARKMGWKFRKIQGDMSLVQNLVDGVWPEKAFLVVPPGHRIVPRYDDTIAGAEPA